MILKEYGMLLYVPFPTPAPRKLPEPDPSLGFAASGGAQDAVNALKEVRAPGVGYLSSNEPLNLNSRVVVVEPKLFQVSKSRFMFSLELWYHLRKIHRLR
jgi:hypothetical protein